MSRRLLAFLQLALLLLVAYLLVRIFPFAVRLAEGAALGIGQLGLAVLVLSLSVWAIWLIRSRNRR